MPNSKSVIKFIEAEPSGWVGLRIAVNNVIFFHGFYNVTRFAVQQLQTNTDILNLQFILVLTNLEENNKTIRQTMILFPIQICVKFPTDGKQYNVFPNQLSKKMCF